MHASVATIAAALQAARRFIPLVDARVLLRHLLACSHASIEAHRQHALTEEQLGEFESLVRRRSRGEPIAYITGVKEFYGRQFRIGPAVLIPRAETELLVDLTLEKAAGLSAPRILDLGTGSGVLAVTLALELPRAHVTGVDNSYAALEVARSNARTLGASVQFVHSEWLTAVRAKRFDAIVANPPYVAVGDRHLAEGDLPWEPPNALLAGKNGLEALRRIISAAPGCLDRQGWFFTEHGFDQAEACRAMLSEAGLVGVRSWRDLGGIERVTGAFLECSEPSLTQQHGSRYTKTD